MEEKTMQLHHKAKVITGKHIRKKKMLTCRHTWVAFSPHLVRLRIGIENNRGKRMFHKLSLSSKYSEN
ncbi:hypothetical protein B9Y65_05810 [Stenotrophomonas maltophilia]|nr:hypothetical protein B9Y57_05810 [Stenotrophomonas maltophilia]PJL30035.1 hypothetical protein B9Y65_05810 [Stenotrophomonas maltophilia]